MSLFVLFGTFPIFLGFSRFARGWSGDSPDSSLFSFSAYEVLNRAATRNSPGRVRDTIWTFPEKSGKPPGLETPRFSFSQELNPFSCESPFGRPKIANRRFEAIRATRSHIMNFFSRKTKGMENSGEEKTYHKNPSPKAVLDPPSPMIRFPPPLFTQCHFPQRERAQTRPISLSEPSKTDFGEHTLWYISPQKIARYILASQWRIPN